MKNNFDFLVGTWDPTDGGQTWETNWTADFRRTS